MELPFWIAFLISANLYLSLAENSCFVQYNQGCMNIKINGDRLDEPLKGLVGRPGKMGPPGPPGERGPPGTAERGSDIGNAYENRILRLEAQLLTTTEKLSRLEVQLRDVSRKILALRTSHQSAEADPASTPGPDWFKASNNQWLKLIQAKTDYKTARTTCQNAGGDLATISIRDKDVKREIVPRLQKSLGNKFNVWVGLDDLKQAGKWVWADDMVSTKDNTDWNANEPNAIGKERCARIIQNGKLMNYVCNADFYALCERSM